MIEFRQVVKSFGERKVLKGLSFRVEQGEILFILGTSGTGKSVLLKNIVGLLKPDSGEIWLDQLNVASLEEEELLPVRRRCGMVFQHPALFDSLTIFENVAFGLRRHFRLEETEVKKRVLHALELVHLKNIELKFPGEISYGMQKRVSLARTIAIEPEILLFDEPTTGLDPITTNAINQLIFDLSRSLKTTSIVVSHDMHCAMAIADQIIVLDQGNIVDKGNRSEIRRSQQPLVRQFMEEIN